MPVVDEGLAGQNAHEMLDKAAEMAEAESAGAKPFVTGDALANEEQEVARNRRLMTAIPDGEVDARRFFRAPAARRPPNNAPVATEVIEEAQENEAGRRPAIADEKPLFTSDMPAIYVPPHELAKQNRRAAPTQEPPAETSETASSPPASAQARSTAPAADEEGARLEQEILGTADPSTVSDEFPDVEVDVAGKKVPLSRIRAGDEALRNRMKLEQEFAQKNQAMNSAWRRVMEEEARGMRGDLIGAARRIGMSDSEITAQFTRQGLAPLNAAAPRNTPTVTSLPEDADPIAKALFAENRAKDQMISQLSQRVDGMEQSTAQERVQRQRETNETARLATISGVKSHLKATALKMPSMRDASGQLSPTASVLVDYTMLQVDREINSEAVPEHEAVRARAIQLFGLKAREHGVTSKADQARRALEQRKPPVPARAGTTNSGVHPGSPPATRASPGTPQRLAFDWTDDDQRKRAMRAEMARIESELTG